MTLTVRAVDPRAVSAPRVAGAAGTTTGEILYGLWTTLSQRLGAGPRRDGQAGRPYRYFPTYTVELGAVGIASARLGPAIPPVRVHWADVDDVSVRLRPLSGLVIHTGAGDDFLPMHHEAGQLDRLAELIRTLAAAAVRGEPPEALLDLLQPRPD